MPRDEKGDYTLFHGHKVYVVSEAEAEVSDALICVRVADMEFPAPGSRQALCVHCASPVWWDARNSPVSPPKVCMQGAPEWMKNKKKP